MKRLESYMEAPPDAMTDNIVKILAEVLSIMGIATKEIKQRRPSELIDRRLSVTLDLVSLEKIIKKLLGRNDIENALKKLDKLTEEESRMSTEEIRRDVKYMNSLMRQSATAADVERGS